VHVYACVYGNACVYGDAEIISNNDFIVINNLGSANRSLIIFRQMDGSIIFTTGCFSGTREYFIEKIQETHKGNYYAQCYLKAIELSDIFFSKH
jgi:hypothetical protein